jgi:hypothetical protein
MTYAREHQRAVRRIKAKKVQPGELRTWEKKRLAQDGQSPIKSEKK